MGHLSYDDIKKLYRPDLLEPDAAEKSMRWDTTADAVVRAAFSGGVGGRSDLDDILLATMYAAFAVFAACHAESDFCIQSGTVFGGWNRITFDAKGWVAFESHCTPDFLERFTAGGWGRVEPGTRLI